MAILIGHVAVLRAIDEAEEDLLKTVLLSICRASPNFLREAAKYFSPRAAKRKAEETSYVTVGGKRRKVDATNSPFDYCRTCKQVFDTRDNCKSSCQTDPESPEINEDLFPDDDELMYPDPEGPRLHERDWEKDPRFHDTPEGFAYHCCGAQADGEPCVVQKHLSITKDSASPSEDENEEEHSEDGEDTDEPDDDDEEDG